MTSLAGIGSPSPVLETQQDFQRELLRMEQENYRRFRPAEVKKLLHAYFLWLEREITGEQESVYADRDFILEELQGMIPEMEALQATVKGNQQRAAALLSRIEN